METKYKETTTFLDFVKCEDLLQYASEQGRESCTYVTHYLPPFVPEELFKKKVRIVHLYRNPKDIAVSYFSFIKKLRMFTSYKDAEWRHYLDLFLDGKGKNDYFTSHCNYELCYTCFIEKMQQITCKSFEAKERYRGVFEIQKSGDNKSLGEIGLDIRTHAGPK